MKKSVFNRTLIHEIGHFIANVLNDIFNNKQVDFPSIKIIPVSNHFEFRGETKHPTAKDYDTKITRLNAEYIGVITYGCIFQVAFMETHFESCFCDENECNGFLDRFEFRRIDIPKKSKDMIISASQKHSKEINLYSLLNLVSNYLDKNEHLEIDGKHLNTLLNPFISEHLNQYENFVKQIEKILKNDSF